METSPDILIYGSGALACLFAYQLAEAGLQVSLLDRWLEGVTAIKTRGMRRQSESHMPASQKVNASTRPEDFSNIPLAIVLVKSWQTSQAAADLAACLAPNGLALTLQNGLGNLEILGSTLGARRAAVGTTTYGATLLNPGVFRPGGMGIVTISANLQSSPMAAHLLHAGFQLAFTSNLDGLLWAKLIINAAVNPLTALLEVPNGQLLQHPHAWQLVVSSVHEAVAAARSLNITLPNPEPLAEVEEVIRRTGSNQSSMLQDILRGAPTEIDAITGALLSAAAAVNLPLPTHQTLFHLVKCKIAARQATPINQ